MEYENMDAFDKARLVKTMINDQYLSLYIDIGEKGFTVEDLSLSGNVITLKTQELPF